MSNTKNPLNCSLPDCNTLAEENGLPRTPENPPLCPKHNDISILVDFMQGQGLPLTLLNAVYFLEAAMANGGTWNITAYDLITMLPEYLETLDLPPHECNRSVLAQPGAGQ